MILTRKTRGLKILIQIFTLLLLPLLSSSYSISGIIYNTFDRVPIVGALISLKTPGTNETVISTNSQVGGRYSLNYPAGTNGVYQVLVEYNGRFSTSATIALNYDYTDFDFPMLPIRTGNDMEFVVYWGASPKNLDIHLFTPWNCDVSNSNKNCQQGNAKGSFSFEDSDGWGPEAIVLTGATDGRYEVWINLVSNSNEVFTPATMKVPEVWVTSKIGSGVTPPLRIPTTIDPNFSWWRAVRLDVVGSTLQFSYPNTVHTTKPVYPFPPDPAVTTGINNPSSTTSSTPPSSSTTSSTPSSTTSPDPSSITTSFVSSTTFTPNPTAPFNVGGCSEEEKNYCQVMLNICSDSGQNSEKLCGCFSDLGFCLEGYDCFDRYSTGFESECMKTCSEDLCYQFGSSSSLIVNSSMVVLLLLFFLMNSMM